MPALVGPCQQRIVALVGHAHRVAAVPAGRSMPRASALVARAVVVFFVRVSLDPAAAVASRAGPALQLSVPAWCSFHVISFSVGNG